MGLFYTGKGDKGQSYIGKLKIKKTDPAMQALGELDTLNSLTGVIKNERLPRGFRKILEGVQKDLFIVQANVAYAMIGGKYKPPQFGESKVKELEIVIDDFEKKVEPARKFVIPGTTPAAARLDYLRAVARNAERSVLKIGERSPRSRSGEAGRKLPPTIFAYLNRLSSLFFAMARMAAKISKKKEEYPDYK